MMGSERRIASRTLVGSFTLPTLATLATLLTPSMSQAAGLYFSDRGVRPMGRAGAYVAGVDDLHGSWYNPAGIADAGSSFLADFAWLRFHNEYTRELRIVDADGVVRTVRSPTVRGSSPILPIPTLLGSLALDKDKRWTIAAGVLAPYVALASYGDLESGEPSPARYALGSFDGSALAVPGAWLAWKPFPDLRIGVGALALTGIFQSDITFSMSPQDRILGAPEQPEFDAQSRMRVGPIFAPTGNGGVIWSPDPHIRIGASGQLPMVVNSAATIKVRLPTSVTFDGASVKGEEARVRFKLPAVLRFGVEVRPTDHVRIEGTYVREFWSAHDSIEATPEGISLDGITGAPASVTMPTISIPRHFQDSNSFRIGGEYNFDVAAYTIALRTGVGYESSAVPPAYLSLSSLDFSKTTVALGGTLRIRRWRFEGVYTHTFASSVYVPPGEAQISRINPLKGNAPPEAVNGGTYHASADLIGAGIAYAF